jgi:hypothetical protein|tara:strand:+ start:4632 stop:6827 length:2196 start_codon:yes stop_codon:yes gene_type:complete
MPLNPSPQRQSVVTFPTPNVNDILFFESVDAERIGTDVPEYGSKHPDYKKWPDHRLVHVEAADDQSRYYRYYYAADQLEQDNDNWSLSKADIGGTKFDAVMRDYVVRRSEFTPDTPAMGGVMPDVPTGKFSGTHVLAERKQVPLNDKILNGLYVVEQRVYVKKVPLTRLDFDEFFKTTNETKQILYYRTEIPAGQSSTMEVLAGLPDNSYWGMNSGTVRTVQQLSDNWYAVTEQEVVKCSPVRIDLQTAARQSVVDAVDGLSSGPATQNLFSNYPTSGAALTRNTACWAHNLKGITGFVAWNDRTETDFNRQLGGVLITPRHILCTGHAKYTDSLNRNVSPPTVREGDVVYFCARDNTVHSRTVLSTTRHANWVPSAQATYDVAVCLLDSELPPSIEIVKVLPKDAYKYFQTDEFTNENWASPSASSEEVLVMTTDQYENAHIRKIQSLAFGSFDYDNPDPAYRQYGLSPATGYLDWDDTIEDGDSGSIATMVVGDECVLLGLLSTANAQGAFLGAPRNFKDVNDLLTSGDVAFEGESAANSSLNNYYRSGYQLEAFDLSSNYKNYRDDAYLLGGECARLSYETVVNYAFPPILQDPAVRFDIWNMRSGGARTYPSVLYAEGAFKGPCRATVAISWSVGQPTAVATGDQPRPEAYTLTTPLFTLSIPPTLHTAQQFLVRVGTEDQTWEQTSGTFDMEVTNVTEWHSHIISSEVKPFRGGWILETITIHPPS